MQRLVRLSLLTFALTACDIAMLDPITRPNKEAPDDDDDGGDGGTFAPPMTPPERDDDVVPPPPEPGPLTPNPACTVTPEFPDQVILACGLPWETSIVAVSPRHIATTVFGGTTLERIDRVTKQIETIAHAYTEYPETQFRLSEGAFVFSKSLNRLAFADAFTTGWGIRTIDLASGTIKTLSRSGVSHSLGGLGTDLFYNATPESGGGIQRLSFHGGTSVRVGDGDSAIGTTGGWTYFMHYVAEDDADALSRVRTSGGAPQEVARNVTRFGCPVALDANGGAYYVQRGTLEEPWRLLHIGPEYPWSRDVFVCSDVDHCGDRPTWVKLHGDRVFVGGDYGRYVAHAKLEELTFHQFIELSRYRGRSTLWFEGHHMFEVSLHAGPNDDTPLAMISAPPLPPPIQ